MKGCSPLSRLPISSYLKQMESSLFSIIRKQVIARFPQKKGDVLKLCNRIGTRRRTRTKKSSGTSGRIQGAKQGIPQTQGLMKSVVPTPLGYRWGFHCRSNTISSNGGLCSHPVLFQPEMLVTRMVYSAIHSIFTWMILFWSREPSWELMQGIASTLKQLLAEWKPLGLVDYCFPTCFKLNLAVLTRFRERPL